MASPAGLATLDATGEALLQAVERESGTWLLAYDPAATTGPPPPFAAQLTPAKLSPSTVDRLRDIERRTGSVIVAYQPQS